MDQIFYDRSWYQQYAKGTPLDEAKKYLEYRVAFNLIQEIPHCGKSLDIGTATGRYLKASHRLGYDAYGIDISPVAVEISRNNLKISSIETSRVLEMNACQLDFPNDSFQLVTCMMGTFAHLSNPTQALA